jgi:hypothetical protein
MILIQASSAANGSGMVAVPKIHPPKEEAWMNFYTQQHNHYCGIDLHAGAMSVWYAFIGEAAVVAVTYRAGCDSKEGGVVPA